MTLVIQSQETLEKLEDMVIEMFSEIPNNGLSPETFMNCEMPFEASKFHKVSDMFISQRAISVV